MGIFSSKSVTHVGTSVSRVIEDGAVPDSIGTGAAKNLFDDGSQLTEYVLEELGSSLGLRAGRMHKYGSNGYPYGLPSSTLKTSAAGKDATQAAIAAEVGAQVSLDYYHFGAFNNLHHGWQKLVSDYGYDSRTNQLDTLSSTKGTPVYLRDMQAVVTNATLAELANGSMDQWGEAANAGPTPVNGMVNGGMQAQATPFAVDPNASADYIQVDYCWVAEVDTLVEGITIKKKETRNESLTFPVGAYDDAADYHQARYVLNGKAGFWTYRNGTGTMPAVDSVFDSAYQAGGRFFPIMYFRYQKKSALADKNSDWYKGSVKLADYVNMDFEAIATAVDQNPDIADVEQAMMMMAVPANTSNPLEQRYLFDFFSGIQSQTANPVTGTGDDFTFIEVLGMNIALKNNKQASSIIIQDKRFKMALSFDSVVKSKLSGNIGPVGSYQSGTNSKDVSISVPSIGGGTINWNTGTPQHWYRRQISDAVYEEIRVFNLKMTYWIFENYTTVGDEGDDILLIPLNEAITSQYSITEREVLYSRSMHYIFNSRVVTKLKWYQTGLFKALMIIVTIVVTVISYGTTWAAMAAAVAAGTITLSAVIAAIAIGILKYLAIQVAIHLFVKVVGAKFALLAALVAAIAGVYQTISAGSVAGAPWAKELLSLSTGLSKGVGIQLQDDMNDLLGEQSEFETFMKEQTKLLDEANSLLDNSLHMSPLIIFGESPDEFYQRTVHSGNIGPVTVDAVTSYVDVALQLPRLSQTLGDFV